MPRTAITKVTPPTEIAATGGTVITPVAADIANLNQFALTGNEIVLVLNSAASTGTVTVTSDTDRYGRTKDITAFTVPAAVGGLSGMVLLPRFSIEAWQQPDGNLYLQGSAVTIFFVVITI
jgi:hypothetical protein